MKKKLFFSNILKIDSCQTSKSVKVKERQLSEVKKVFDKSTLKKKTFSLKVLDLAFHVISNFFFKNTDNTDEGRPFMLHISSIP